MVRNIHNTRKSYLQKYFIYLSCKRSSCSIAGPHELIVRTHSASFTLRSYALTLCTFNCQNVHQTFGKLARMAVSH